jgi:Putative lumazine-binding
MRASVFREQSFFLCTTPFGLKLLVRHHVDPNAKLINKVMTKFFFLIVFAFSCNALIAQGSEEDAIKQVITLSYIGGIQNNGSSDDIRKGFHPSFNMLRLIDNEVKPYPIEEWIAAIEKRKSETATSTVSSATGKFINVDVTGNAAVVKLELYRDNKKTFTDYLILYKFKEGWKIVSKTYFRHPG